MKLPPDHQRAACCSEALAAGIRPWEGDTPADRGKTSLLLMVQPGGYPVPASSVWVPDSDDSDWVTGSNSAACLSPEPPRSLWLSKSGVVRTLSTAVGSPI